jgi:hypothetical protein
MKKKVQATSRTITLKLALRKDLTHFRVEAGCSIALITNALNGISSCAFAH